MRSARFVCLFVILISMLVLAQSSRAPLGNQPNGMPTAQQRHPALPPNLSQMPQGAPFAQRGARAFKETATRRGSFADAGAKLCARCCLRLGWVYRRFRWRWRM